MIAFRRMVHTLVAAAVFAVVTPGRMPASPPRPDPLSNIDLPDEWEARFWVSPNAWALLALSPIAAAELVPTQAGVRFCRCPACDSEEGDETLAWSVERPRELTCRHCGVVLPNDKYPAADDKKSVPEVAVEVLPRVIHRYPYHVVDPERQRYPDERLYLAAKADHEAREFLAKAALYAAVRYHEPPTERKDRALGRLAAVLLVRFAQVYPAYATHYDQPGSPKYFDKADLSPPYRRAYGTGKWDSSGSLDVPLDLVAAYALLRDDPVLDEAGRLLEDTDPRRRIERDLFLASAAFVRGQPEAFGETSLQVDRGILAVGRLLRDPTLVRDAQDRLSRFAMRGFHHDGFWHEGTLTAHQRVVGQLDGWIERLLSGDAGPGEKGSPVPMLALARGAGAAVLEDARPSEVSQASWPARTRRERTRAPMLLGGTELARLAVGQGDDALDLELRSLDSLGSMRIQRQALRVAVGGETVLGDLDELPPLASGFDRASASHNTVVVDGLNQRESLAQAREFAEAGSFRFFAADPDFQAATLEDRGAYPQSTARYRQTLVASAGAKARYAVAVFEVQGGLQHDQFFHGPARSSATWRVSVPTTPGPASLLPPGLIFVPSARAEDDRWFVQAQGEFTPIGHAALAQPAYAWNVDEAARRGVRLHLLGDTPASAIIASSPAPPSPSNAIEDVQSTGRSSLIVRRRSADGSTLGTTFVTVIEPVGAAIPPLKRVGRVASPPGTVVVYVETDEGVEHVVLNLAPGTTRSVTLGDGQALATDGLAVRVSASGLVLAGGTLARQATREVRQEAATGRITGAVRRNDTDGPGFFVTNSPLAAPQSLEGRVVLIRHADGSTHGWTLRRVENIPGGARLYVREEPGFELDHATGTARFYQFPLTNHPGPHTFRIGRIARQ